MVVGVVAVAAVLVVIVNQRALALRQNLAANNACLSEGFNCFKTKWLL